MKRTLKAIFIASLILSIVLFVVLALNYYPVISISAIIVIVFIILVLSIREGLES